MATLVGIIQGILAGISVLAVGVAMLYIASFNGAAVRIVTDGTIVELSASQPVPSPSALSTEDPASPVDEAGRESDSTAAIVPQATVAQPTASAGQFTDSSAAQSGYRDLVAPDLSAIVVALGRLSSLLANPRPEEEGWRSDVMQLNDIVRSIGRRLALLQPPADATATHAAVLDVTGLCMGMADSLAGDISQVPITLFPLASEAFQRCSSAASQIAASLY